MVADLLHSVYTYGSTMIWQNEGGGSGHGVPKDRLPDMGIPSGELLEISGKPCDVAKHCVPGSQ